jgi:hypothetical protein
MRTTNVGTQKYYAFSWAATTAAVVLVCLAVLGCARAVAEEKPMDGPIRIEIALDKKEYRFRDSIPLTITYTNTSKEAVVLVANGRAPGDGFPGETFEITTGAGRKTYTVVADVPASQRIALDPGKSWKRTIKGLAADLSNTGIEIDGRAPDGTEPRPDPFGRLDDYTIKVRYEPTVQNQAKPIFGGKVESNTVKLRVVLR